MREGTKRNRIRYSTVLIDNGPCIKVLGGADARVTGSILVSKKSAIEGAAAAEQNFTSGDPKLADDHTPKPGSPVIGAGKGDAPAADHAGKKRPATPSLGAFEPRK